MKKFIFLIMSLPLLLWSQSYNIDQIINTGLDNSLSLKQSELGKRIAESQLTQSYLNVLPEVTAFYQRTDYLFEESKPQGSVANQTNAIGLEVEKTIKFNNQDYFSLRFAQFDKNTAVLSYENQKKSLALNIFSAYIAVLDAQKQLETQKQNQLIQENILKQTKALFGQKKNTEFDVTQNEITLLNVKITIQKLNNEIKIKRAQLFNLINSEDLGYDLQDISTNPEFNIPTPDFSHNLELLILKRDSDRYNISINQSFLNYMPDLSLRYNYSFSGHSPDFTFNKQENKNQTISINASYSLWNFLKTNQSHSQVKMNKQNKELSAELKLQSLQTQFKQYKEDFEYYTQLDGLYKLKKENTALNLSIAENRYELGMIDPLELDKARYENFEAISSYDSNKYRIIELREKINFLLAEKILNKY